MDGSRTAATYEAEMTIEATPGAMNPEGLRAVETLFQQQLDEGLHPGSALAVYWHGRLVLELFGGQAERESGRPVTPETLFVLFSATKPLSAVCLHILLERGRFDLDDPVARFWPEFARNGKAAVTVRHVLTHSGGFPQHPPQLPPRKWGDWKAIVEAMEEIEPIWEPGQDTGYHPLNFGWVVGELVRRIDGRPISQFLKDEVAGPLGMRDTYLGLPPELEGRVARLYAADEEVDPRVVAVFNRPEVHQAVIPAGCGISTARDLARFYAALAAGGTLDGTRILSAESVERATALQVHVQSDRTLGIPMRWALGFHLGGNPVDLFGYNTSPRAFGHGGHGSSVGWADPDLGVAVAIITNGLRSAAGHAMRVAALSEAIRKACL
jgi:CubicO group peptidase (beta-lactamase class C family)